MLQDGSPTLTPESSATKTAVDLVDEISSPAKGKWKVLVIKLKYSVDRSKTTLYYLIYFKFNELFSRSVCPLGYTGNICEIPCRYPSFGKKNCQSDCNCTEKLCNHITGCRGLFLYFANS